MLDEDEKNLGVCLIDIGGGTTDIAVFIDGAIRHSAVIPIAGDQVTNDIAVVLRTPMQAAEKIKLQQSCALKSKVSADKLVDVVSSSGNSSRQVAATVLAEIIEARYAELFALVASELRRSGFFHLVRSGIVMTGGAAKVKGGSELAEKVFDMPVRVANPVRVTGDAEVVGNPVFATAVGLLHQGYYQENRVSAPFTSKNNGVKGIWGRVRAWLQVNF